MDKTILEYESPVRINASRSARLSLNSVIVGAAFLMSCYAWMYAANEEPFVYDRQSDRLAIFYIPAAVILPATSYLVIKFVSNFNANRAKGFAMAWLCWMSMLAFSWFLWMNAFHAYLADLRNLAHLR
jgi:hypothetical protein